MKILLYAPLVAAFQLVKYNSIKPIPSAVGDESLLSLWVPRLVLGYGECTPYPAVSAKGEVSEGLPPAYRANTPPRRVKRDLEPHYNHIVKRHDHGNAFLNFWPAVGRFFFPPKHHDQPAPAPAPAQQPVKEPPKQQPAVVPPPAPKPVQKPPASTTTRAATTTVAEPTEATGQVLVPTLTPIDDPPRDPIEYSGHRTYTNAGCNSSPGQTYGRLGTYLESIAACYAWYSPKDQYRDDVSTDEDNVHDWQHLCVWISNEIPYAISYTANERWVHDTDYTSATDGHPIIRREYQGLFNYPDLMEELFKTPPLISWTALPSPARQALQEYVWGDVYPQQFLLSDANFSQMLAEAYVSPM